VHLDLLSGNYLFQTPTDSPSVYFHAMTIGFGVLFLVSAIAYWRRGKLAPDNPVARRVVRRATKAGMWIAGIGLFFALMRYAQVDYVGMPLWLLLLFISTIVTVGYFVYELSERYPMAVWRLQESSLERRYRPAARPPREPQRQRPKVRGKRRR
jgi:hypothetical protein